MSIYDAGTASLSADGTVTGVGTTWQQPLTLIRVGATMVFKTNPVTAVTVAEILSDTSIRAFNTKSTVVPAGTQYFILAHDGITVQGLAQDVAETLRYYQSQETSVASLVELAQSGDFDFDRLQNLINEAKSSEENAASSASSAAASQQAAAASQTQSASSASSAQAAYNNTVNVIENAGDAGTLVTLSGYGIATDNVPFITTGSEFDWQQHKFTSGESLYVNPAVMINTPNNLTFPPNISRVWVLTEGARRNSVFIIRCIASTGNNSYYREYEIYAAGANGSRTFSVMEKISLPADGSTVGGASASRVRDLLDVYSKAEVDATRAIAKGGTGSTTAAGARTNLDVYAKGETYSMSEISSRYSVTLKDFGAVGDGVADDSDAMNQLSAFVNARAKYSAPVHIIIPNGVYNYSNGLNFVRPVSVTAEQGATLNYLGTGAAIAIGDPSLDDNNPTADGFYQGEYTIDGVRFTGGQSASYGIYIRSYVFTPHIYNCEFMDFGTADSWAIYSQFECWDGLIKDCAFHNYYNKTAVGNFIGISGKKATSNVFDGGNSRFTIQDCSMTSYDDAPLGFFAYINSVKCVVTGGNCHWSSGGVLVGQNAHGSTIENFYTEVSTPNRPWMVTVLSEGGETAQNVLIKNCYANMHSEVIGNAGKIIGALDEGVVLRGWRVEDVSFSTFQSGQTLINMTGNAGQFGNTYARIKPVFNPYSSGAGLTYTVVNNPVASVNAWSSDDIEEGFWTPTLGGGATYNLATGYYRKQGKMVTCEFDIHVNSIAGGETGRIGGLPFPNGSMTGAGTVGYYAELALPVYWLGVRVDGGSNLITISGSTTSAVGISGQIAALKSSSRIIGSVTYFTS